MIAPIEKQTSIYIAGPMQGLPMFNFPAFDEMRDYLQGLGFKAISPADMDRDVGLDPTVEGFDQSLIDEEFLRDAQRRDCDAIINDADAMVMLVGWQFSTGAKAEYALARWKHIPIYTVDYRKNKIIEIPKGLECLIM